MEPQSPPIVVVIPTANRVDLLERTLKSLAACTLPTCYERTLIVENGSRHGARAVVERFPDELRFDYLYSEPPNKSTALNLALDEVEGHELLLFTDDDARFDSNWVAAYAEAAEGVSGGVMYGGPFGVDYEVEPAPWIVPYLPYSAQGRTEWDVGGSRFDAFLGINWAAFAHDIETVGRFDESRGPGLPAVGQEYEMQYRLHKAGVRQVLLPGTRVWHYVPAERCSREWLVDRRFRTGVSVGRARLALEGRAYRWFRLTKSLVYHLWRALRGTVSVKKVERFGVYMHLVMFWGIVVGVVRTTMDRSIGDA